MGVCFLGGYSEGDGLELSVVEGACGGLLEDELVVRHPLA